MDSVLVPVDGGELPVRRWLPEAGSGPGIVVVQEIFGLSPYILGRCADLAEAGYVVAIVKSPFDLPLADITAARGVIEANPDVQWWGIGGHSLGGVAASSYAAGSSDADALVLWASYPYLDLSDLINLPVLSVSGSNDGLTTPAEVESAAADLPPGTDYVEVPGAVHAFFGDYGEQDGDGVPETTRQEAQQVIVDTTLTWLNSQSASP